MNEIEKTAKKIFKSLTNPDNKLALIPNWLSFSRAVGGVTIPIMIHNGASVKTLTTTLGALAVTDLLDGKIARSLNVQSEEGALVDVVADKIFSVSLIAGIIPKVPTFAINGALEATISYINAKRLITGDKPHSNFLGKVKIWPLSAALILSYGAIAISNTNKTDTTNLMQIGKTLSYITIPLELINIKQYYDDGKDIFKGTNKIKIDKLANLKAIVVEKINEKNKEKKLFK